MLYLSGGTIALAVGILIGIAVAPRQENVYSKVTLITSLAVLWMLIIVLIFTGLIYPHAMDHVIHS